MLKLPSIEQDIMKELNLGKLKKLRIFSSLKPTKVLKDIPVESIQVRRVVKILLMIYLKEENSFRIIDLIFILL